MRKIRNVISALYAIMIFFATISCSNSSNDDHSGLPPAPATIEEGYIRVNFKGNADSLWIWNDFDKSELDKQNGWPNGVKFTYSNGDFVAVDLKLASNPTLLGMIPLKGSENLTGADVIFYFPRRYNEVFLKAEDKNAYVKSDMKTIAKGVSSAKFTSGTEITLSGNTKLTAETVTLTDKNGKVAISSYDNTKLTITLASSIKSSYSANQPYTLKVITDGAEDTVIAGLDSSLVEDWFGTSAVIKEKSDSLKLGVTKNSGTASFKTWAPLASNVQLLLFSDSENLETPTASFDMKLGTSGFWSLENVDIGSNKYYKYGIKNGDYIKQVADIWSYAASADSVASQIADISSDATPIDWESNYTNPWKGTSYSDAIIYEMHIRDWSRAVVSDSTGKFLDIANSDKILNHLKDLGVTHVQILPMFDYAQKNDDDGYNWGYNPYHYNVPEGRYVTKGYKDGTQAVSEMREMIQKLHKAGIAVIMDVVYNHTNGTGDGSLYDMTVPKYFYRLDNSGNYVNGSGCGNEIATNHAMVRYYVVESLKHWMKDYHINGFRFDLMGCLETSTMKEIYDELYKIDPKVMVYGEPWTGGTSGVEKGAVKAEKGSSGSGVGAFDDDFRDAIKGAEFGGFKRGTIQGTFLDDEIILGLKGEPGKNERNKTGISDLSLHYIECHDNYTLFDKLVYSTDSSIKGDGDFAPKFESNYNAVMSDAIKLDEIKKQVKLGGAYVILSQGTPFLNGGQEFLRTKKGNPDSYSADKKGGIQWTNESGKYNIDDVNTIDLSMKDTYKDVYNTYKALLRIRKDIDAFRIGQNSYAEAKPYKSTKGVIKYSVYDSSSVQYIVYFNATDSDIECPDSGKKIIINELNGSYSIEASAVSIGKIPAKSFVILKK